MEKKLRIQLFDEEGRLVDDRTVSQNPEISSGPKISHEGIFRIEFTLDCKDDVEKVKIYLDQFIGNLPLGSKSKRKKKVKDFMDPDRREELLEEIIKAAEDQDKLIEFLREQGFRFMMTDFLETFDFPGLVIKDRHKEKYQWMLGCSKYAKNPKSDKYDPMLIFGIQLLSEQDEKIVVYLNGEYYKSYKVPVPTKPKEVFKKTTMTQFPHYMTEEERERFRRELRKYENDNEISLSKFFKRWMPYVKNLPKFTNDKI